MAFRLYVPDALQFGQELLNNQLYLLEALGLRCLGFADLKKFGKVLPRGNSAWVPPSVRLLR